ncbi:UDP-N-acetylmuramoyl-L-alanine--D-glutamate ligase [Gryllotalpicola protaetiae]|uniref:UDP-N-acetylmuramoylalanine--D-glutamate ligase n=1 Tax=Gryllotalpicola protaetiae TaxID=2419771 RepID=A0A387BRN6_9MICO|nr:UDP-N-acetylmuramoyl-L-alanine--D-glutamate ligase [Gryllotalpicola protaetiae]AYG04754.1 UDP-N-acetylmuramoyl-L-alanine--D-glutamate ligase [Gryllotalpicola protaetiae]
MTGRHAGGVDFEALNSWHTDAWKGVRVAVFGLGKTGFSVADTLVELGSEVLVVTQQADAERARLLEVIGAELVVDEALDAPPARLLEFDPQLVVANPGFPPSHPILRWAEGDAGLPVWGDIELAWRLRDKVVRADGTPAEWITITGTNGKTTTTQLTATFLKAAGLRAAPAGNIGVPVLDAVRDPQGFDVLVIELSSHQLHRINENGPAGELHPFASVCLNIAEDHLEWHGSFDAYRAAKAKVYANTKVACVYNKADEATIEMVEDAEVEDGARAIGFGLGVPGPSDFGVIEGIVVDRAFLDERHHTALELTTIDELAEAGLNAPHIVANILAAAALARSFGVETGVIHEVLKTFRLDAHRIETVAAAGGVVWVDDSKATNPHAADASLKAFPSVVWVAGGLLKGAGVDELVSKHVARLRAAVLIGAERGELREALGRHAPELPVFEVDGADPEVMATAVRFAASVAQDGDTVLLAPAAASMDQFTDYADRGNRFAAAVRAHLSGDLQ